MTDAVAATPIARRIVRLVFRQAERFFAVIGLGTVVYFSCFSCSRIISGSMAPTLQGEDWEGGDRVLTERLSFRFRQPRRWEVITIRQEDGDQIMKRVVALPGEKMQMLRRGRIFIDGREIHPPETLDFLDYFAFGNLCAEKTVDCGDGYYVLGDDSRDSDDSRFNGPVAPERIIGRAWVILGPAGRRGWVR